MVVHFRELGAHRNSVLELYRQLLRHTTHLSLKSVNLKQKASMIKDLRSSFKRQKPQMSPWIVTDQMNLGYSIELKLREIYQNKGSIHEIVKLIESNKPQKKKVSTVVLKNVHGQPMKMDLDNMQYKPMQRVTNYINRYIRKKQRLGELPKTIDPVIRDSIIKDEALFQRAMLDVNRARRRLSSRPYKVRITSSSRVYFIRGPWVQSRKISEIILNFKRREQELFNLINYYEANEMYYDFESEWNAIHYNEFDNWSETVVDTIVSLRENLDKRIEFFKSYSLDKLPRLLRNGQKLSNQINRRSLLRFNSLVKEIRGVTAFETMLGKESLRELVRKHKFKS